MFDQKITLHTDLATTYRIPISNIDTNRSFVVGAVDCSTQALRTNFLLENNNIAVNIYVGSASGTGNITGYWQVIEFY